MSARWDSSAAREWKDRDDQDFRYLTVIEERAPAGQGRGPLPQGEVWL